MWYVGLRVNDAHGRFTGDLTAVEIGAGMNDTILMLSAGEKPTAVNATVDDKQLYLQFEDMVIGTESYTRHAQNQEWDWATMTVGNVTDLIWQLRRHGWRLDYADGFLFNLWTNKKTIRAGHLTAVAEREADQ
jgi:hypothetical protein